MTDKSLASLDDLWGTEFGAGQPDSALLSLLTKQADALTRRTKGKVVGQAHSYIENGTVWTILNATVPALQGYRRQILSINHPIERSPVDPTPVAVYGFLSDERKEIDSMEGLIRWLSETLSSPEVHTAIENFQYYSCDSMA